VNPVDWDSILVGILPPIPKILQSLCVELGEIQVTRKYEHWTEMKMVSLWRFTTEIIYPETGKSTNMEKRPEDLLDQAPEIIRVRHYSIRTERGYLSGINVLARMSRISRFRYCLKNPGIWIFEALIAASRA
jgi:hypothetical protein